MTPRTPTTDREEVEALTKALTGLTCGGSEFFIRKGDRYVADIDACVAWVRRAKEDAHRRSINAILARQAAEAKFDALRAEVGRLRSVATRVQAQAANATYNLHQLSGGDITPAIRAFNDIAETVRAALARPTSQPIEKSDE